MFWRGECEPRKLGPPKLREIQKLGRVWIGSLSEKQQHLFILLSNASRLHNNFKYISEITNLMLNGWVNLIAI